MALPVLSRRDLFRCGAVTVTGGFLLHKGRAIFSEIALFIFAKAFDEIIKIRGGRFHGWKINISVKT